MKRRVLSMGAVGVVLVVLASCTLTVSLTGTGPVVERDYPAATGFRSVSFDGVGALKLTQGTPASVTVRANENLFSSITVGVVNGQLLIGEKPWGSIGSYQTLEFDVTVPTLDSLTLNGVGSVETVGSFSVDSSAISLNSVGSAKLALDCSSALTVSVSGAGGITLTGSTPSLRATLSGVGSLSARNLTATDVSASISGVGGAQVTATRSLTFNLSGIGSLTYWGYPSIISGQATGIGTVHPGS